MVGDIFILNAFFWGLTLVLFNIVPAAAGLTCTKSLYSVFFVAQGGTRMKEGLFLLLWQASVLFQLTKIRTINSAI